MSDEVIMILEGMILQCVAPQNPKMIFHMYRDLMVAKVSS